MPLTPASRKHSPFHMSVLDELIHGRVNLLVVTQSKPDLIARLLGGVLFAQRGTKWQIFTCLVKAGCGFCWPFPSLVPVVTVPVSEHVLTATSYWSQLIIIP